MTSPGPDGQPPPPSLRDLVRAAAAAPDAFEALARRLMEHGPDLDAGDLDAILPEVAVLHGDPGADPTELALTLTETGTILSASPAAVRRFALPQAGADQTAIGLSRADLASLRTRIEDGTESGTQGGGGAVSIVLAHPPNGDDPLPMTAELDTVAGVFRLRALTATWPAPLDRVLEDLYGLSPRERQVLRALHAGASARAIADTDGRALGTVRQQVKSILSKLGMGTQGQVQTFLAAATTALRTAQPDRASTVPLPDCRLVPVPGQPGREVGMRSFGDTAGLPCLVLHGALFGLGAHAGGRVAAQMLGLRMIGPERAGYGQTRPHRDNAPEDLRRAAARDALACLDAAGVARAVVLAQDTGLVSALTLAAMAPDRVAGIVAVSATPPLTTWDDSAGMPPQQRVFALCMLRAPALADALVTLGLSRMRRLGQAAWPEAVFAGVPHDVEVTRQPANLSAVTAAYAFNTTQGAAGFRLDMADLYRGWGDLAGRVACPVVFVHGAHNRTVDVARVQAFARGFALARVQVVDDAGHSLELSHPALILRQVLRMGWDAGLG